MPPHFLSADSAGHSHDPVDRPRRVRRPGEPLRIGVGGPVGSGKTALVAALCRELRDELTPLAARHDDLLASLAPLENLARAEETLALAGRLRAEGGPHWLRYQRFLACERGLP